MYEKITSYKVGLLAKKSDKLPSPVKGIDNPFVFFSIFPVTYYNVLRMLRTCYQEEKIGAILGYDMILKTVIYNYQLPNNKKMSTQALMELLNLRFESDLNEAFLRAIQCIYAYYFETNNRYRTKEDVFNFTKKEVLEEIYQGGTSLYVLTKEKNDFSKKIYTYFKEKLGDLDSLTVSQLDKRFMKENDKELLFEVIYKIGYYRYQTKAERYLRICRQDGTLVRPINELFTTPQSIILLHHYEALPVFQNSDNRISKYLEKQIQSLSTEQYNKMLKEEQEAFILLLKKWEKIYLYQQYKDTFLSKKEFDFFVDSVGIKVVREWYESNHNNEHRHSSSYLGISAFMYQSDQALFSQKELERLHKEDCTTEEFFLKEKIQKKHVQLTKFLKSNVDFPGSISMKNILSNPYLDEQRFKQDMKEIKIKPDDLGVIDLYLSSDERLRFLLVLSYYYMKEQEDRLPKSEIIKFNMQWLFIDFDDFFHTPYFEEIYTKALIRRLLDDKDMYQIFSNMIEKTSQVEISLIQDIPYPLILCIASCYIKKEQLERISSYAISLLKKYENMNIFEYVWKIGNWNVSCNIIELIEQKHSEVQK